MSQPAQIMLEDSVFGGGIVLVEVGRAKREVHVHRRLLQSRSPYFSNILSRSKDETATIALFDVQKDVFCMFLSWLYANCFIVPPDDQWMNLCKLWLLAERFKVPALQNQVVEVFSCRLHKREIDKLDLEILHYAYDNTGPGSALRKMFTHISTWYGNQDVFARMMRDMPPIFHADYAAQHAEKTQKLKDGICIDPWDLTEFLLPEVVATDNETRLPEGSVPRKRNDSVTEDRQRKRKRASA